MNNLKSPQGIQEFLSIGYIYLIIIGILSEALYYAQIGINILDYSSILDVLISPISRLTSNPFSLVGFIIIVFLIFKLPKFLAKYKDKKWFQKSMHLKSNLSKTEAESSLLTTLIFMLSLSLLGLFVGSGLGSGVALSKKIEKEKVDYNDHIEFINGDLAKVEIVGENSNYIFYLKEDNKTVQISPISGVIKSIEKTK